MAKCNQEGIKTFVRNNQLKYLFAVEMKAISNALNHCIALAMTSPPHVTKLWIFCDASRTGIGGYIGYDSENNNGSAYPVIFDVFSSKLSGSQLNWTVTKAELFAVYQAVRRWEHWILGCEIKVHTDHSSLIGENGVKTTMTRCDYLWWSHIAQHNIALLHHPGHKNALADILSRVTIDIDPESLLTHKDMLDENFVALKSIVEDFHTPEERKQDVLIAFATTRPKNQN